MCYHWEVQRKEVSEEEWLKILDTRGQDIKFQNIIFKITILPSLIYTVYMLIMQ